jgi:malate dehydrogenase (quinone)
VDAISYGGERDERRVATNMPIGTDVNELTRSMFNYLTSLEGVTIHFNHEVRKISKREDGRWRLKVTDLSSNQKKKYTLSLFHCAGGGSLPY